MILSESSFSQKKLQSYVDYIQKYATLAVYQMNKYKIPASITLSQALLESGAGKSTFAIASNNHFGIKCHRDWKGDRIIRSDDSPNECFRKYNRVEDSYEDHSLFLSKSRYTSLFSLDGTDYKNWARGLQTLGYATDRAYANKLIKIIEDYQLYQFDTNSGLAYANSREEKKEEKRYEKLYKNRRREERTVYKTFGLIYVIAGKGDSFQAIADDLRFKLKDLLKYNEVPEDFPLNEGDIVYLQKKKDKADKPYYQHVVQIGESMHSISQKYGIKLKSLYKLNKLSDDYIPEEGDVLILR